LKILSAARLAGIAVELSGDCGQTPCGLAAPELQLADGSRVRHLNAILRRIAHSVDAGLSGASFIYEGEVDSWLDWCALEVDHTVLDGADLTPLFDILEGHLKSRTFLVGQRLTVADLSVAISLRSSAPRRETHPATTRWFMTCVHQLSLPQDAGPSARAMPAKAPAPAAASQAARPKPEKTEAKSLAKAAPPAAPPAASEEGDDKKGKKDEKKKAKEEEKKAKEEEKRRREAEMKAAQEAKTRGPDVTVETLDEHTFGHLFIRSECKTGRTWTPVKDLTKALDGQKVWLRGRVDTCRKQGGKLCFIALRQTLATVQVVVLGDKIAAFGAALPPESVVDIYGVVTCPETPIASCTQSAVEVQAEKVFCIGRAQPLPLQLADAARSEADLEKDPKLIRVGQDVRLDNRIIDLRTAANQAIFRIQSGVCALFREFLSGEGFTEIHSPKMISAASEGGADVFRVDYFEGNAYLAQSPQLYKQMVLMADMGRVFEIGPIFRSENSLTHRHMTEFTGLDLEMTFNEHYHEVLDVLDGLFNHIFTGITKRFPEEMEAVRAQYPFENLKWKYPCLRLTFAEAIELLRKHGPPILEKRLKAADSDYSRKVIQRHLESVKAHEIEEDISTEDEKVLGEIISEQYNQDFYLIDKFPVDVRPFYTMVDPKDPRWTNAYDFFVRGEEITSGAQRIHDFKLLAEKAQAKGVELKTIQPYIDAFMYGAFPHAGAGIGLERVVMLFLKLNNIRKTSLFPRDPKRLTP